MIWVFLGILAALAAAVLTYALLRQPRGGASRIEHDLEVYRAQLEELDREHESGLISGIEAEAARIEIQRRILAADQAGAGGQASVSKTRELVPAAIIGGALPLAALALYFVIGSPQTPSVPFAERPAQPAPGAVAGPAAVPGVETMMAQLRQRLAQNPDDLRGWIMLGRSEAALGDYEAAVEAYDRAVMLAPDQPDLYSAKVEAMIMAAQGIVAPEARAILQQALSLDPSDARARFYMAAAEQQAGDLQAALERLTGLLEDAPPDAAWYAAVRARASGLATQLGLDPAALLPEARAATEPLAADPRADAEELAARLERDPKDFEGWIELARMRSAQGDREGARQALDLGAEAYQGAPFVQQQFRQAAAELGLTQSSGATGTRGPSQDDVNAASQMTPEQQKEMIRGMVGGLAERLKGAPEDLQGWQMLARSYGVLGERENAAEAYRHVLTLDSADTDALFFLGEAASRGGDKDAAAGYWTRLLALLAPGSAEHALVKERLGGLKTAN